MKFCLTILFCIICVSTFSQTFPITQSLGSKTTLVKTDGSYGTTTGFTWNTFYADTTTANSVNYVKYTPGIIILTSDNKLWLRNSTVNAWIQVSGGASTYSAGSGIDITGTTISNIGRFGKSGEDVRATAPRTFSFANNAMKWDSLGDGTRWVTIPKTLGGRTIRMVSTNGTDSGFVSVGGDLTTQLRTVTLLANSTSRGNVASVVIRGGPLISDININVTSALHHESVIAMDSSALQLYRRNTSGSPFTFPAASYFYDDSVVIWSGINRESQISLFGTGSADQWAINRLAWRTLDSTAKIVLTHGLTDVYADDSVKLDNDVGYYRFTNMTSTSDSTAYKPVVMDINGKIKRGSFWGNFAGSGSGSSTWNGITDPTGTQTLSFDDGEATNWTVATTTTSFWTITESSLTSGSGLTLTTGSLTSGNQLVLVSASTALAAGNEQLDIRVTGANGTSGITATGARISVTNTNATSGTNVGLAVTASGATTANVAVDATGDIRGSTLVRSPIFVGSSTANGTITIEGNNAGSGNTSTNANTIFKVGDTPTQAMDILNNGMVRIGSAPNTTSGYGMTIDQPNDGASDIGLNIRANNHTASTSYGYGKISASGALVISVPSTGIEMVGTSGGNAVSIGTSATAPTSTLMVNGSFGANYVAKGIDYTATATDYLIELTVTGKTVTLPTAASIAGRMYVVKLTASTATGTVATTSSQTIDGSTTYSLSAQYKYVAVMSNGSNWIVIANN